MFWLIDEISVPPQFQQQFLTILPQIKRWYQQVAGVKAVAYLKTTRSGRTTSRGILKTVANPPFSYLLIIKFANQQAFQDYHDHTTAAQKIHRQIASHVGGHQLEIKTVLHGNQLV